MRKNRLLWIALLAVVVYHGGLLLTGTFKGSYDAYVHIFFADHYARDWFSTWEPRWYTGFTVTSYPPGSHQAVALLSFGVGLEAAFALVQLGAVLLLVIGVWRFTRIWAGDAAAGWAALLAAASASLAEAVHVFGQLPTILALALLLNALPSVYRWVVHGERRSLLVAVAMLAATTASHHVTTLFGAVFFVGPVVLVALLDRLRTPVAGEVDVQLRLVGRRELMPLAARRLRRVLPGLARAFALAASVPVVLASVVLPYWLWTRADPIQQIPIPHGSRASFLAEPNLGLVFWLIPWGALLIVLPLLVLAGVRGRRSWPLALSVAVLALLGTGGTTPIPRMLLGGAYEILTLDRFTIWATIAILPLAGRFASAMHGGALAVRIRRRVGSAGLRLTQGAAALVVVASSLFAANLSQFRPMQPDPIEMTPVVDFLAKDDHDEWRYLTLGFGDQMAWLSAQTTAATVDGNYHSVRRLPELVSTKVERLEGAKFTGESGIRSLRQFLTVPERYSLKYVFANDEFYDPLLHFSGWHRLGRLDNGVMVWEREDVPPLAAVAATPEIPAWQALLWGLLPIATLLVALPLLAAEIAGFGPRLGRGLPLPLALRGLGERIDGRLAEVADRLSAAGPTAALSPAGRFYRPRLSFRPGNRVRRATISLLLICGAAFALGSAADRGPEGPDQVVAGYYGDLDHRRFANAWERLDPGSRPGYEAYRLQLSVQGGLLSSYSILQRAEARVVRREGDTAVVEIRLSYLTAIERQSVRRRHDLRRVDGRWAIAPPEPERAIPDEQLSRRPGVEFISQGRRRTTDGATTYADVLDRPELSLLGARLVRHRGRLALVGEVLNEDVDPADVTVTGQLVDRRGSVLGAYNAGTTIEHKIAPQEATPFRVDFEAADRRSLIGGSPLARLDPLGIRRFDRAAARRTRGFDVYAKAVVSDRVPIGELVLRGVRAVRSPAGWCLRGEVFNGGTEEATVPHLTAALRDDDGAIAWVDDAYLDQSVRPGRARPFRICLKPRSQVEAVAVEGRLYDNGPQASANGDGGGGHALSIRMPASSGWASVSLQAGAFSRGLQA